MHKPTFNETESTGVTYVISYQYPVMTHPCYRNAIPPTTIPILSELLEYRSYFCCKVCVDRYEDISKLKVRNIPIGVMIFSRDIPSFIYLPYCISRISILIKYGRLHR